jgi:hypothetical protein
VTITLTSDQESTLRRAIQAGVVESVDQFIESAIEALPAQEHNFDSEKARAAVERIRETRTGVKLDLRGMSLREFAHIGHKY